MKIFLAGTNSLGKKNIEIIKQSKYFLESFFYIKKWQLDYLLSAEDFILDSGAFSFMGKQSCENFELYIKKYANFVNEYDIQNFIELDIESVVGWDEYRKLNDILIKNTKKQPIPVFHIERGKEWYLKAIKKVPYIAFGGIAYNRKKIENVQIHIIKWAINEAHKNGVKIHGLGFTSTSYFDRIKFDTIDSTSWTIGNRYGNMQYFKKNGELRQYYPALNGKRVKNKDELTIFNYLQWCKFQKYAEIKY